MAAAGAAIRRGQIVVLPTDTVYGVGCDAFDADAVAAVLAAKGRGRDMPPPVLLPTASHRSRPRRAGPRLRQHACGRFWPGPLTVILKAQTSLHWDLGDTNGTVALRVPDNPIALELLGDIGPMAVTSANTTGARRTQPRRGTADAGRVRRRVPRRRPERRQRAVDHRRLHRRGPVTLRLGALAQADIDAALAAGSQPESPEHHLGPTS